MINSDTADDSGRQVSVVADSPQLCGMMGLLFVALAGMPCAYCPVVVVATFCSPLLRW